MKYIHTNLTVDNLDAMSAFYQKVFGCTPVRDPHYLDGQWIEQVTKIKDAAIHYVHLTLPGYGPQGPQLELIQYENEIHYPQKISDCSGFGHLAFSVENVPAVLEKIKQEGGGVVGELVVTDVPNRGRLTEVYATDPEGNIIELQHYE
ncbi:MAG: VOC family protein [Gammaproteobacteria bacterium]|nr:VOC family protein [Gammaproteobacteria bacterium]MDH5693554.1 VOC family protein [Gammaproteobacteria bacterium]